MGLYNSLNQMIRSNALRNTSGPTYVGLDPIAVNAQGRVGQAAAPANRLGTAKWQSLFPGIGVSVTVEGQYANLRRFVRDLEASNQFIVINAVELEKATNTDEAAAAVMATAPPGGPQQPSVAGTRGTLVSLRVDLAAYFRRNNTAEETAPPAAAAAR
jgi:hypothetical protein